MRILLSASGSLDRQFGGGQTYVRQLAAALKCRGHDVCIVSWDGIESDGQDCRVEWRQFNGVSVAGLAINSAKERASDGYDEMGTTRLRALRSILTDLHPDFVHINGMMPPLSALCREMCIPHAVAAHHPGEVCPNGTLLRPDDTICRETPRSKLCVPCVCRQKKGRGLASDLLARLPRALYRPTGALLNRFHHIGYMGRVLMYPWLVEQKLAGLNVFHKNARCIIAPSHAIAEALQRAGVPSSRIRVISHGIAPVERYPIPPFDGRPIRFGFIGRIDRAKGLHVLFRSFGMLPTTLNCELHIFGDAQNERDAVYFRQAQGLLHNRPGLVLHGAFQLEELASCLAGIDVLVLPAISLEVFGLSVAEAFSAGRPAIVSDCGGPAEQVTDGVNGRIVPPNDAPALAEVMSELARQPMTILEWGAHLPRVKRIEEYVDEMERLYCALIDMESATIG
jgi:glycosyltransferase involved in cell wall biosynthesis